jgi:hypothetical protein
MFGFTSGFFSEPKCSNLHESPFRQLPFLKKRHTGIVEVVQADQSYLCCKLSRLIDVVPRIPDVQREI